jgi:hypothetical protein
LRRSLRISSVSSRLKLSRNLHGQSHFSASAPNTNTSARAKGRLVHNPEPVGTRQSLGRFRLNPTSNRSLGCTTRPGTLY